MARPLRIQYPGAFYHVMCRGNERKRIFIDSDDHVRFLRSLEESLKTYQVVLYTYVMMPNHFHLVVQTRRANLGEFMRRFNICYTGWFNYHHHTCGHLYQGRYKALLVDADHYLLKLSHYVHLNPVQLCGSGAVDNIERWNILQQYQWSSLPGYLSKKKTLGFVNYEMVLSMAGGRSQYRKLLRDDIGKGMKDILRDVKYQTILGDDSFVEFVKSEYVERGSLRDQPSYRDIVTAVIEPDVVVRTVAEIFDVSGSDVCMRWGDGVIRGVCAELMYRYCNLSLREIGKLMGGIDYGGVHQLRRRLRQYMAQSASVIKKYQTVERLITVNCSK